MCVGGRAVHIVNGKVVNVVTDTYLMLDGEKKSITSGKIQLQSEGASIEYKNIEIKELTAFPAEIKKLFRN